MEIQEEINFAIESADSAMPENLRRLRRLALSDLDGGPVYLDADGDPVSRFDEGARRFDFEGACNSLSDWADSHINDVSIETDYCEETDESTFETIDGSGDTIRRAVFGPLVNYI